MTEFLPVNEEMKSSHLVCLCLWHYCCFHVYESKPTYPFLPSLSCISSIHTTCAVQWTPEERDQCPTFHMERKKKQKQLSLVCETFCIKEWFSISGSQPTLGISDAVKHPSVQHRMSSETLLKTTEPSYIGKARRRR